MTTNNAGNNTDSMAANSIRGNNTGAVALGIDLTVAQTNTLLGVTTIGTAAVGQVPGTATNDNAAAGKVGEFISSVIASGSAVSLSDSVAANVTSISLTAGDWDVWGNVTITGGTTNLTNTLGWISSTSATLPDSSLYSGPSIGFLNAQIGITVPSLRFSLASPTTIYLSGLAAFAASTATACGGIYARRRR